MRLRPRSVRLRLTLWHAASLAAIILLFSLGIYLFVRKNLVDGIDRHVSRDLTLISRTVASEFDEVTELIKHQSVPLFHIHEGDHVIAETDAWKQAGLSAALNGGRRADTWSWTAPDGNSYRLKEVSWEAAGHSFVITVAHDMRVFHENMHNLAMTLLFGIPAALVLAAIAGYLLAGRMLSPITSMAATAREITADRLSERLPVGDANDEFGQLAAIFNQTFMRLEDSFQRLRRFTDDASHELRTPLTALRSVGEVGLQENNSLPVCREAIGSMLEEADRLTKLVDSLLTLSRADSGAHSLNRAATDLGAFAADVTDCLHVLAEEKGQELTLEASEPVYAEVDSTTLRQALINLLDNAIKYTPCNGTIRVVVGKTPEGEALLEVIDNGPGIPREHHDKIFDRFYRVDKGRSREVGGTGLGLSIARWAVEINNGRLEFESEEGRGSTFCILLPILNRADPGNHC